MLCTREAQIFDILMRHLSSTGQQYFSNWWGLISATFAQLGMEPYRQTFVCSAAYYKASLGMYPVKFLWSKWSCSESWGVITVPPSLLLIYIIKHYFLSLSKDESASPSPVNDIESKFLFSSPPHFISGSQKKKFPFQMLNFFFPSKRCLTVCDASWVINPGFHATKFGCSIFSSSLLWDLSACNMQHGGASLTFFFFSFKSGNHKTWRDVNISDVVHNTIHLHAFYDAILIFWSFFFKRPS